MLTETRQKFAAYQARQAELNGVPSAAEKFAVAPSVEQKLFERVRQSADFLNRIGSASPTQQMGDKVGMDVSGPAAGRTDTRTKERVPRDLLALDDDKYACVQTNFDTSLRYETLDAWAKFPEFQTMLRDLTTKQIARDRLTIGWNGKTASADTDLAANPLLQDVNVGWLEKIRANAPARVMTGVKVDRDVAGHDYVSLDALVFDVINELIAEWHRESPDLVVIAGSQLLTDKYLGLINSAKVPTEINALNTLMLSQTLGGKPAMSVPFFPARALLVTSLKNLSIYTQSGTTRRQIVDNPKRDRVEDFVSCNEAYVVEDYTKAAFVDGIKLPNAAGEWA